MTYLYKYITIKGKEQLLNLIIVFTANFKVLENESK